MENEDNDQSKPYTINNDQLIDSSILHHNINPDCPVCLKPVFWSRHILALDRVWHIQCFICCYCYKSLKPGEQTFHSGKIYCTDPCFSKIFLIKCTGHNSFEKIQNLENQSQIEKNLENQLEIKNQSKIEEDQKKLDNEKIEKEKTNLKDEIKKDNNNSKNKCFHCLKCSNLIMNHHHHILHNNNYPFCKFSNYKKADHLTKIDHKKNHNQSVDPSHFIGQNCSRCNKKVFASELCYSLNSPFHLQCLKCKICNCLLQPGLHTVHNGLPICCRCNNRFYSFNGFRKGWYESKP